MIKYLLLLVLLPYLVIEEDCKIIAWEKDILRPDDFQLKPDDYRGFTQAANTNSKIFVRSTNLGGHLSHTICAYFNREKSWKKSYFSNYILNHEQRHFDIAEIYARKIRKSLDSLYAIGGVDYDDLIKNHLDMKKEFSRLYDFETKHSIDKEKQSFWDKMIDDELQTLEKYKSKAGDCTCLDE